MRSLKYLNSILTVLAVLLTLQLYTAWMSPQAPSMATEAHAQDGIPNAGAQRKEMIDQLKRLSQQVEELNSQFKTGRARVMVEAAPAR
jgi:peptidoglycan hydrolase CwlO-like protein